MLKHRRQRRSGWAVVANYGLLLALLLQSGHGSAVMVAGEQRKVILIGVDGVQYEILQGLDAPNFERLHMSRLYTGGVEGQRSKQKTVSGPGWTTVLTGVWVDRHGVKRNDDKLKSRVPGVFDWVNRRYPDAVIGSFVSWGTLYNNAYSDLGFADRKVLAEGNDEKIAGEYLGYLKQRRPDFSFLYLGFIDTVGHQHGFGPQYDQAIQRADGVLGQILDWVDAEGGDDNWLVVVTTDHGRRGDGRDHGKQTPAEKTAFIATNQLRYHPAAAIPDNDPYRALPHTYVADVIYDYLGISPWAPGCEPGDLLCAFRSPATAAPQAR